MDAKQLASFQEYLDQRNQEMAAGHQQLMQVGQNTASLLASQFQVAEERQLLMDLATQVKVTDGTCPNAVRLWIKNIDRATTHTTNMVLITKLVRKTIMGPLQFAVESFLTEKTTANIELSRNDITWSIIKPHVKQTFLPYNESELLVQKLSLVRQGTNEDLNPYKLRFLEAVEDAYPVSERTLEATRKCIKFFLKGLASSNVTSAVLRGDPQTLEDAIRLAEKEYHFDSSLQEFITQRVEVPMDISAVPPPKPDLEKQLQQITSKLAKLEARQDQVLPPRQYRRQQNRFHKASSWTSDGNPVCYNCGVSIHISKQCRAPRRQNQAQGGKQRYNPKQATPDSTPMECAAVLDPTSNPFVSSYQPHQGNF